MATVHHIQIFCVESAQVAALPFLKSVDTCSCRICSVVKKNWLAVLLASRKKRKQGRPTTKPIHDHIKICSNCFPIIAKGSNHSAAQCKYSKRTKITKLVEISSPTTLQHAASRDRDISDCPVTPLARLLHLPGYSTWPVTPLGRLLHLIETLLWLARLLHLPGYSTCPVTPLGRLLHSAGYSTWPVTPLGRPKKKKRWKRTFFHLPTVRVYRKIWVPQDLGSVTPRQIFYSVISGWQQDLGQ